MADHYFIFNGIDTRDYGFIVTGDSPYAVNAYSYDVQSVDGRDGDIIYSHDRHSNIDVTYSIAVKGNGAYGFRSKFEAFRRLISGASGYCTLTDSYNPGYIRYGYLKSTVYPTQAGVSWSSGKVSITFSCKPQMFLSAGMDYIEYPLLVRGKCTETGIADATGVDAHPRVGEFSTIGHEKMYFRTVNATADETVKLTQVSYSGGSWDKGSADQTEIVLPKDGSWVSADVTQIILWFEFGTDLAWQKDQYLEFVFDDTDDTPYRYSSQTIVIINDTQCIAKPQFIMYAVNDYRKAWRFGFYRMAEKTVVRTTKTVEDYNIVWIQEHTSTDTDDPNTANFDFDSDAQTIVNDNGGNMAKYVKMTVDEDATIFSQYFPVLYPGLNHIWSYYQTGSSWSPSQVTPYRFYLKSNIWTV